MSNVSKVAQQAIEKALDEYWESLQDSQLADKSIEDYYYFAFCFVRWIRGDFVPGGKLGK